ncbi:MAG: DUF4190 domain-containing protein [Pyrinomonadaceae bacterium]
MKKCPFCQQTYTDDSLNFCLNDGGTLTNVNDEPPPTVFMNEPRVTSPTNWTDAAPPAASWQNSPMSQNSPFMTPMMMAVQNKTLPTVSLVLAILSFCLFCCFGGIPLSLGALITGYLGFNNANNNSQQFGGRGLAIAGMIMGAVSFVGSLLWLLLAVLGKH